MTLDKRLNDLKDAIMALAEDYDEDACQRVLDLYEETRTAKNKAMRIARERADEERRRAVYEAERAVWAKATVMFLEQCEKARKIEEERNLWKRRAERLRRKNREAAPPAPIPAPSPQLDSPPPPCSSDDDD